MNKLKFTTLIVIAVGVIGWFIYQKAVTQNTPTIDPTAPNQVQVNSVDKGNFFRPGSSLTDVPLNEDEFTKLVGDFKNNFVSSANQGLYTIYGSKKSPLQVEGQKIEFYSFGANNTDNDTGTIEQSSIVLYSADQKKIWAAVYSDTSTCPSKNQNPDLICIHYFTTESVWAKMMPALFDFWADRLSNDLGGAPHEVVAHSK